MPSLVPGGNSSPLHLTEASTPDSSTKRPWSGSPSAKPGAQTHPHPGPCWLASVSSSAAGPHRTHKESGQHSGTQGSGPPTRTPGNLLVAAEASGTEPGLGTLPSGLCSVTRGHSTPATPTMHVYRGARPGPPRADSLAALGARTPHPPARLAPAPYRSSQRPRVGPKGQDQRLSSRTPVSLSGPDPDL